MSSDFSRKLAISLGETEGRSVSQRTGGGLSNLTGGAISPETGKVVVHVAIVAGVATAVLQKASWRKVATIGGIAALLLWIAGRPSK